MMASVACKLVNMLADMLASSLDSMLGAQVARPVAMAIGVLAVPVMLGAAAPASAEAPVTKRSVLGSVLSPQSLEISTEPGTWTPAVQGAAVVEDSELRSGPARPALIGLGTQGVISLREGSRLRIGRMGAGGLPVTLRGDGAVNFRLPAGTRLQLLTDAAVLSAGTVDGLDTSIQGIVSQHGGVTVVSVVRGTVYARQHDSDEIVHVARGEQATFRKQDSDADVTRVTGESNNHTRRRTNLGLLGQSNGLIIAGATLAAVGGGIGIAAAAGAFDSSSGSGSNQSSPFEP
jgi:hypothetical protein